MLFRSTMSSIFTADTSTQGTGGITSYTLTYHSKTYPNIKMNTNCGIYNSGDNTIKLFTNGIDALTIDASQKVSCDGSLITNISYTNLINKPTLFDGTWNSLSGKPTNFQADWNSTIINKPDLSVYATTTNLSLT